MAADDIETGLTERAWRDPEFASLLTREPAAALAIIGVELPKGVRVEVKIQEPNTLYYLLLGDTRSAQVRPPRHAFAVPPLAVRARRGGMR